MKNKAALRAHQIVNLLPLVNPLSPQNKDFPKYFAKYSKDNNVAIREMFYRLLYKSQIIWNILILFVSYCQDFKLNAFKIFLLFKL